MINYGILSTARIVNRFVAGIRASQEGNVYAIASRNFEKAKEKAEELGIERYYGSYDEIYNDPNIDVVYIPTTNDTHYTYAKEALQHHKNVILEKPFVLDYKQSEELFDLAKENNCFLMEGQKSLFLPVTVAVKKLIDEKVIGDVQFVQTCMSHPARHPKGNWMYDLNRGGGALNGSGAYPIEYVSHLLSTTDFKQTASFVKGVESADNLVNFLLTTKEAIVNCIISMDVVLPNHATFYGSKGQIVVENFWKADKFTLKVDGKEEVFEYPFDSEFKYEVDHVNNCIKEGKLTSDIVTRDITTSCVKLMRDMYTQYEQ